MQISLVILAIFAAAAKDVNGIKLNVSHATLGKRQSSGSTCISTCQEFSNLTSQCSLQIATYAQCICSTAAVQSIAACVNCGVLQSASQADINAIESSVNTYISSCAALGYPITIPVTTAPTASFACTISFNTVLGTQTSTTPRTTGQQTVTVTTGNPFAIPTDFSIDPSQLSLISALLGGTTTPAAPTGL